MSAPTQPKCIGILGRLFGHKFVKSCWTRYGPRECYRCGYRP